MRANRLGETTKGRLLVTAGLGLVALMGGTIWSSMPYSQLSVGSGELDVQGAPPGIRATDEMAQEERERLEALGYLTPSPGDVERRERRKRRPAAARRSREPATTEDDALRQQLMMLGYTSETSDAAPAPAARHASARRGPVSTGPVRAARPGLPPPVEVPSVHPGFQLAIHQPYSTFAVDVDDASWVRTRERLRGGGTPDASEVRLEEFVNAMPYRYPAPTDGDFAVQTELVAHPGRVGWQLVRVGVQGRSIPIAERPPLNLTFLVDTSGSMGGRGQLRLIQQALDPLVAELGPADTLSLVSFDQDARVDLSAVSANAQGRQVFDAAVDHLRAGGGTGMSMGLDLAYEEAARRRRPGTVSRVVLVSDGDANIGRLSGDGMAASIEEHARNGILLTALGVGTGRSGDQTLETLSNLGHGQYFALADLDDARQVLVDDLVQTFVPLARDVKLQVEWDPSVVRSHRILGYDNRQLDASEFRQDAVDGGEVGMGHQVTALFVVERVPGTEEEALGVLRLRSEAPGPDAEATETAFVLHGPVAPTPAEASDDTIVAMAAAFLAAELRGHPMLPIGEVVGPLREAVDRSERDHLDLLRIVGGDTSTPRSTRQGRSGVVSLRTDPGAFDEVAVRCEGAAIGQGTFQGGRAVVAGLPNGPCVADLRGGRPTVSLAVAEGRSYRCDGQPLRCRAEE